MVRTKWLNTEPKGLLRQQSFVEEFSRFYNRKYCVSYICGVQHFVMLANGHVKEAKLLLVFR